MKTYRILATKIVETTTLADDLGQAAAWAKYECARDKTKLLSVEELPSVEVDLPPGVPEVDLAEMLLVGPVGGP